MNPDLPYPRIVGQFREAKTVAEIDAAGQVHREEILKLSEGGDAATYNAIREAFIHYRKRLVLSKWKGGGR